MRVRLPSTEDYLELTPGDQAAFLLGGAAGLAADLLFTLGLSGGAGAMVGASTGVGAKRAVEAWIGQNDADTGLEDEARRLHAVLLEHGATDLAGRLERYRRLRAEGLIDDAGFRARLDGLIDAFAGRADAGGASGEAAGAP